MRHCSMGLFLVALLPVNEAAAGKPGGNGSGRPNISSGRPNISFGGKPHVTGQNFTPKVHVTGSSTPKVIVKDKVFIPNKTIVKPIVKPIVTKPVHVAPKFVKNYHLLHGTKFSGGFCYTGKHHCHWSYRCFLPRYGCDCYWCPSACCWYYWCQPRLCYLPVTYITSVPPVVVVAPTVSAPVSPSSAALPPDLPLPPDGAGKVEPYAMAPAQP